MFSTNTKHLKATFNRLLLKQAGERSEWEYPFAAAGINVSFMLIQMLDLHSGSSINDVAVAVAVDYVKIRELLYQIKLCRWYNFC